MKVIRAAEIYGGGCLWGEEGKFLRLWTRANVTRFLVLRFLIGGSTVALIGYIILISSRWPGLSYAGTIVVTAGMFPSTAVIVSWPANNVSGQTKRATASALQISVGNIAAIMGTQLYRPKWSPRYFVGHGMVGVSAVCLCVGDALKYPYARLLLILQETSSP